MSFLYTTLLWQKIKILKSLQKRGVNLFLQIHDFAEDGRPFDYFADEYPADCHNGVINQRDYEILLAAGLKIIDFGILDETPQKEVMVRLISSRKAVEKLIWKNSVS
jgi:hypothetical protein